MHLKKYDKKEGGSIGKKKGIRASLKRMTVAFVLGGMISLMAGITAFAQTPADAADDSTVYETAEQNMDEVFGGNLKLTGKDRFEAIGQSGDVAAVAAVDSGFEAKMVKAMKNFSTEIKTSGSGLTRSNISKYFISLLGRNPEIVYLDNSTTRWYYNPSTNEVTRIEFGYEDGAGTIKSELEEAIAKCKKEINTADMSKVEKVLAYHEYITSIVAYAYDEYTEGSLDKHGYDMYGILVRGSGVCQGYAETMMYFMKYEGIPCCTVGSNQINHAWNIVRIDGQWYHVDSTWDDLIYDNLGRSYHNYFLLSTSTINDMTYASKGIDRSDMEMEAQWGGTYTSATDTRYETNRIWSGIICHMEYDSGYWYAMQCGTSKTDYQVFRYSFATGKKEILVSGTSVWYSNDEGTNYYTNQYGSVYISGTKLYFTTAKCLYYIDLSSSVNTAILYGDFSSKLSYSNNFYHFGRKGSQLLIGYASKPNSQYATFYYIDDACVNHTWNSGVVKKAATETSTGIREYTCQICGAKSRVTIPKLPSTVSLKASVTASGVKLSWSASTGAQGYKVYRKKGTGSYELLKTITSVATCSYSDTQVTSGTVYTYKVVGYNGISKGGGNEVKRCFIKRATAKTANVSTGVKVSWNKVGGITGYKIYRKAAGGNYACIKVVGSGTLAYIDKTAKAGTKYAYAVKAYKSTYTGTYVASTIVRLKAPTFKMAVKSTGIKLAWTRPAAAKGYLIYRKTPTGSWKIIKKVYSASTLSWIDTTANKGQIYYYTIKTARDGIYSAAATAQKIKR